MGDQLQQVVSRPDQGAVVARHLPRSSQFELLPAAQGSVSVEKAAFRQFQTPDENVISMSD
jgi:hypothetical protein